MLTYSEFKNSTHLLRFLIYCSSYFLIGALAMAYNSLIPFYAQRENNPISAYSFILIFKIVGYLIGTSLIKLTNKCLTINQSLDIGLIITGVFAILFNYTTVLYAKMMLMVFLSIGMNYVEIFVTVGTLYYFQNQHPQFWLQLLYAFAAIAGFIAPLLIGLLQITALTIFAVAIIILSFILFLIMCLQQDSEKQQIIANMEQKIKQHEKQSCAASAFISTKALLFICCSSFMLFGYRSVMTAWVQVYAVIEKINTKQQATIYPSIFQIISIIFRLIITCIVCKGYLKVAILSISGCICSLISVILIFRLNPEIGLIFASITIGVCDSVLQGLIIGFSVQFELFTSVPQNSIILLSCVFGQGLVSAIVGLSMKYIPEMPFYMALLAFFVIFIDNICLIPILEDQRSRHFNNISLMQQKQIEY